MFQKRAQANCNFINISKTLAEHLQTRFCFNMRNGFTTSADRIVLGCCETKAFTDVLALFLRNIDSSALSWNVEVTVATSLKIGGWNFKKNSVIALKYGY